MSGRSYSAARGVLRRRCVGVCGGTRISATNAAFCKRLGQELAREEGLTIMTGGFRHFADNPGQPSADWATVEGALERLQASGIPAEMRINTLLPDKDLSNIVRFEAGKTHVLRKRSLQARRFTVVNAADALVAVQGSKGTREMIDLAFALEKPCLPLPFTGGISQERWAENRDVILESFDIDIETATRMQSVDLGALSDEPLAELARAIMRLLLRRLKRKCFVMMPFSDDYLPLYENAIKPAILKHGFQPVRADHLNLVGNAVEILRAAISSCDCAVAVITRNNPNVMYELGFAHSQGKPAILVCESQRLESQQFEDLPFDLRNEYVIGYSGRAENLQQQIAMVLQELLSG